ncbi:gephyrin-like molybdotransferase Glp [Undibacterium sp. RuRC25W]|uniref:molybdopterin molybdotransferase MoeA n=1 Tax=Undibacterium sp. RuRC25W TaxID=3413047 RepID=UPI003BF4F39E
MNLRKPLMSVNDALTFLLNAARPLKELESLPTLAAAGRVLAQSQTSLLDVPPMDNTQMDGYAVRAADCVGGQATLRITQRIPAGHVGEPLLAGTAARIFTGAMIPVGADAVVMQEQCVADGDDVMINHVPRAGEWIRRRGEDIQTGATILHAGTRLRAQEIGLAASVGLASLPVWRKMKVAVFFTGDELAMPGEELKPGAIYNSNRFTLSALLHDLGCEVTDYGIVPDTLEATRATLRLAAQGHDLVLTSGGVSVGEEDHIRPAVEAEGSLTMWQIAVKPGKPLAFGEVGDAFFIGLPGNPVSSFVTFLMFVRPFILRMQGVADVAPLAFLMRADFDWLRPDRRQEYLRARINPAGGLDLFSNQGSGVLTSTVWGDGLIELTPGQTVHSGEQVKFIPFSSF